ncbi:hypothetical protein PDQ74_28965 [Bacillus cereus group sp. Bc005]|uniref:hypothetical protein n=1 Tax=unclassified Bacillus cereus group TaxID=2750818 RepID=UPI0022E15EED|nr:MULTISPECIES: hypothetical protein [unclassified Bacillus cereus group]MDA2760920.1 hypothetical protein [Bacillus cereus group sp. Bc007]MDA2766583.1 hypothetical protein [Bacillus cereus group sp. Bc008]MDA2777717.1 hypothetical protein [Bacillus cereus group sp. Bc005]
MAKITDRDAEKSLRRFVHICIDKGISVEKAFELVDELMIAIEEKKLDEKVWIEKVEKAIAEANKEGVTL